MHPFREPEVGRWYEARDLDMVFEIVAIDARDGSIAIQFPDGDIEEMELETFTNLKLREIDQPGDDLEMYDDEDFDFTQDEREPLFRGEGDDAYRYDDPMF